MSALACRAGNVSGALNTALAAQREIARLQRLYDAPSDTEPTNIEIIITRRPDGPENIPPAGEIDADLDPDAPGEGDRADADPNTTDRIANGPDPDDADDADDDDLLDPGDAVPTVTRRAADQPSTVPESCRGEACLARPCPPPPQPPAAALAPGLPVRIHPTELYFPRPSPPVAPLDPSVPQEEVLEARLLPNSV
jgi:hypothetical protein